MEKNTGNIPEIIDNWKDIYEDFWAHSGKCFHYKTTRYHAERYMRALSARIERKNGWQMAEYPGDKSPHAVQNFLSRAAWDADTVRNALMRHAREHLLSVDEGGVLIVDETGFLKKGSHSAGVARQHSETAGRIENSQAGVFLALAGSGGRAPVDCEPYLSEAWCDDKEKRKNAHIPDDVTFKSQTLPVHQQSWGGPSSLKISPHVSSRNQTGKSSFTTIMSYTDYAGKLKICSANSKTG